MTRAFALAAFALLALPAAALGADAPNPDTHLVFPTDQVWAAVAAAFAPTLMYAVNYIAPWTSERVKGLAQALGAAVAAGIAQAITAGDVGFNDTTLQFVVTGLGAALFAHLGWRAAGINTALGGGRNAQGEN